MSKQPKFSTELHLLCGKLRDGELSDAQSQRLNEMLLQSREARRYYRTFMALASALETRPALQESVDQEGDADKNIEDLFGLIEQEEQAEVIPFPALSEQFEPRQTHSSESSMSMRKVGDAASYLFVHGLKSNQAKWLAAAAVVLIGVALTIVLSIGNNDNTPTTAEQPDSEVPVAMPLPLVATLTAEYDAVWDRRPGDDLYAGQRFTLTEGFAEITTSRGAAAIVEAPATIELIDNDNAIRLHAGKLVGICETDSSKGFVVRTPHMDVIDLGTRFGVDATRQDETTVKVFDGEVQAELVQPTGDLSVRQSLTAGDAVTAHIDVGWVRAEYEPHRFVKDLEVVRYRPDFASTNAAWMGRLSGDLRQGKRKADTLQVFLERQGHVLANDIAIDFDRDHPWEPAAASKILRLGKGKRVDVYLLHFDLLSGHEQPEEIVVDFGRPVLGVIVSESGLNQTDATLGLADTQYPDFPDAESDVRGLNYRTPNGILDPAEIELTNDFASLSPDGTQLNLRLWGGRGESFAKMDQVRVIVQSKEATP
jgi:hypothetical protein